MVFAQSIQAEAVKLERQSTAEMIGSRADAVRSAGQAARTTGSTSCIRPRDVFDEKNHEMDPIVLAAVLFVENFGG